MPQFFKVMIRCPLTRQVQDTGIRTTGREGLKNNAYGSGWIACRHCGQLHSMDEEAFFEFDPPEVAGALWRPNP